MEDKFRTESPKFDVSVGHTNVSGWVCESGAGDTDLYVTSVYMVTRTMEVAATDQQEKVQMRRQEGLEQTPEER